MSKEQGSDPKPFVAVHGEHKVWSLKEEDEQQRSNEDDIERKHNGARVDMNNPWPVGEEDEQQRPNDKDIEGEHNGAQVDITHPNTGGVASTFVAWRFCMFGIVGIFGLYLPPLFLILW